MRCIYPFQRKGCLMEKPPFSMQHIQECNHIQELVSHFVKSLSNSALWFIYMYIYLDINMYFPSAPPFTCNPYKMIVFRCRWCYIFNVINVAWDYYSLQSLYYLHVRCYTIIYYVVECWLQKKNIKTHKLERKSDKVLKKTWNFH